MNYNQFLQTEHFLIRWEKNEQSGLVVVSIRVGDNLEAALGYETVVTGFSPSGLERAASWPGYADGSFAYCRYDDSGRLIIGTDRYGLAPLYYTGSRDWLIASTKLSFLQSCLGKKIEPDITALKQLLDLGEILGSRTILEGVSRLREGERIVAESSSWQVETWWQLELDQPLPMKRYLDVTESALKDILKRNAHVSGENLVCPLTGGDDSRRLAFACSQIGVKPKSYTQLVARGDGYDEDTEIGKQLAASLGFEHEVLSPPNPKILVNNAKKVMQLTNGETFQHHWALSFAKRITAGSTVLDGLAAGVLNNGHFIKKHPEYVDCWADIDKVTGILARQVRHASTKQAIKEELTRLPNHEFRINLFYLFNHTRRNIGSWQQIFWRFNQSTIAPFFQPPLFEQALRLRLKDALENSLHVIAMQLYYPKALDIPSTRRHASTKYFYDLRRHRNRFLRSFVLSVKPHPLACELKGINKRKAESLRLTFYFNPSLKGWWRIIPLLRLSLLLWSFED